MADTLDTAPALAADPRTRALLIAAANAAGTLESVAALLNLAGMNGTSTLVQSVSADLRGCLQAVLFTTTPGASTWAQH